MAKATQTTKRTTTSSAKISFNLNKAVSNLTGSSKSKSKSSGAKSNSRCPTCGKFMRSGLSK